jgi:hypothetical protein
MHAVARSVELHDTQLPTSSLAGPLLELEPWRDVCWQSSDDTRFDLTTQRFAPTFGALREAGGACLTNLEYLCLVRGRWWGM